MAESIRISINLAWFKPWLHHLHCLSLVASQIFSVSDESTGQNLWALVWPNVLNRKLGGKTLLLSLPSYPSSPRYRFTLSLFVN